MILNHRIGGLEKSIYVYGPRAYLNHRIGGLENDLIVIKFSHRIGGLAIIKRHGLYRAFLCLLFMNKLLTDKAKKLIEHPAVTVIRLNTIKGY